MTDLLQSLGLILLSVGLFYHYRILNLHFDWLKEALEREGRRDKITGEIFDDLNARLNAVEQRLDIEPQSG